MTVICIHPELDAPYGVVATRAGGTGHWTATAHASFIVVAWDTKEEFDLSRARFFTRLYASGVDSGVNGESTGERYYSKFEDLAITEDDTVTISWTPPRRRPDHYSIYFQATATFATTLAATKILPTSGLIEGNVPGYATSVNIAYDTAVTYAFQCPCYTNTVDDYYQITGNRLACLYETSLVIPLPAGGAWQAVTGAILNLSVAAPLPGEVTRIYVTAATADTTSIKFNAGTICLEPYDDVGYLDISWPRILLNIPDVHHSFADKSGSDILGLSYQKSMIGGSVNGELHITYPFGDNNSQFVGTGDSGAGNEKGASFACYYLQKWHDTGLPVEIFISVDSTRYPGYWYGQLIDVPHMGTVDAQDDDEMSVTIKFNYYVPSPYDLGWYGITAKSAANDTISIDGDHTKQFVAGTKIRTADSTADNDLFAVESSTYTSGDTVITVTGDITDGTADGRVELWLRR